MGGDGDVSLVGRDRELADVLRELRSPAGGGVVLAGPAGIGKSSVLAEVLAARHSPGTSVVSVRATAAAATIPYGAFATVLPEAPRAGGSVRWAVGAIAGAGSRVLLGVDDAHLLDPASAVVVHALAHTRRATIVATVRSGEPSPDPVQSLWKDGLAVRLDLGPFDEPTVAAALRAMLDGPVVPATIRRLHELSAGNALLLREVVLAGRHSGALTGPPWRMTGRLPATGPRLAELVDQRIGALDEKQTDVLEFVALGEPLATDHLMRLCPPDVVEECETRELIVVEPDVARLGHPLFGEVVRNRAGRLRTARRYRELARSASPPADAGARLQIAVWELDGGIAGEPAPLLAAARTAWAGQDIPLATRLADAARSVGGGVDAAILLAGLHNERMAAPAAQACLDAVAGQPMSQRQRVEYEQAHAFALALSPDGVDAAVAVLRRARAEVADREWRQRLDMLAMQLESRTATPSATLAAADAMLASGAATPILLAQLQSARAGSSLALGRFGAAVVAARAAAAHSQVWRDELPAQFLPLHLSWGWAALYSGDLDEAGAAIRALTAGASGSVDWRAGDNALVLLRCQVMRMRGELHDAAELAACAQPGQFAAGCLAERAHALALCGAAGAAADALRAARAALTARFSVSERGWILLAEPWVLAAARNVTGAIDAAMRGIDEVAARGYLSLEALLCHTVVRLGAAARVAERMAALVGGAEDPLSRCYGRHAAAAVAGDGPGLLRVAAEFAELGFPVHAADAGAQAADVLHRAGRSAAARAAGAQAERWGGTARTPALATLALPDLTAREREIAGLAAMGLTSREIAEQLVVSVRTVDNHLRIVYSKLGVTNRRDLPGPG